MNLPELLQKLDAETIVEFFVLDTTNIGGGEVFYFHAGTSATNAPVVWQGITYQPFPIEADGFESTTKGSLPRPRMKAANVSGAMFALLDDNDDLVGAKVVRKRTFARYLDGQPTADPNQHFEDDVYYVERKVSANEVMVEIELASAIDLQGMMLPSRQITIDTCPWVYTPRSAECGYTGTNYFDVNDQPVATANLDVCSKRLTGCKKRFGQRGILPFGGFPAAKSYRS